MCVLLLDFHYLVDYQNFIYYCPNNSLMILNLWRKHLLLICVFQQSVYKFGNVIFPNVLYKIADI